MPPSPRAEQRLDDATLRAWPLPADDLDDKRTRGTVLVIGGSDRTPGAVVLAGIAALRSGAGRLQIVTAEAVAASVAVAVPEALVAAIGDDHRPTLADLIGDADAIVVGPGLTDPDEAGDLLALVLEGAAPEAVVVVDALAIGAMSDGQFVELHRGVAGRYGHLLLTPNREELDALLGPGGGDDDDHDDEWPEAVAAARYGAAVISFEHVAAPDGRVWVDASEVHGLGTSGAGDVLAGVAGGIAARCGDAAQAACWAAATHRLAAQRLSRSVAPMGYLARELADEIAPALAEQAGVGTGGCDSPTRGIAQR
jgi:hydroxyethylthiazole kinase-like uncharacterized protein yjeF